MAGQVAEPVAGEPKWPGVAGQVAGRGRAGGRAWPGGSALRVASRETLPGTVPGNMPGMGCYGPPTVKPTGPCLGC